MESTTTHSRQAQRRNRSIRSAVLTSFLSKAGNALLQLLAIPLAIRVLGRDEFGLFTTVTLALTTVSLLEVGVGPALAHGIAQADARGDATRRSELASTAFLMMVVVAMGAGAVLAFVLITVPIPTLFGSGYAGKEAALRPALWLGLCLFLLLFILNLTERLREGQLEVAKTNLWGALANGVAAIAVGVGVWFVPQVWYLVLAMNGSMVLAKFANTVTLWNRYRDLIPRLHYFRPRIARDLFRDGLSFATASLLTGFVEYNLCGWMVGRVGGPGETALYGVFVSLSVMQLGLVIMLTAPTWPAVAEALARNDHSWALRAARRLQFYGLLVGVCALLGLTILGPLVFRLWLGSEFAETSRILLACFGFYFAAHVWRHVHHALMIGTSQVSMLARLQMLETSVVAVVAWFALNSYGLAAMLLAMAAAIVCMTGFMLPRQVSRGLASHA